MAVGRATFAHDRGYSTTELEVGDGGVVTAQLAFAASDVGATTGDEFLARGVELRADDVACVGTLDRFAPTGADGLDVRITYHCAPDAEVYEVTLYALADMGTTHRNVARFTRGDESAQAILSSKERALRFEPKPKRAPSAAEAPSASRATRYLLPALALAIVLVLLLRRARPKAKGRGATK